MKKKHLTESFDQTLAEDLEIEDSGLTQFRVNTSGALRFFRSSFLSFTATGARAVLDACTIPLSVGLEPTLFCQDVEIIDSMIGNLGIIGPAPVGVPDKDEHTVAVKSSTGLDLSINTPKAKVTLEDARFRSLTLNVREADVKGLFRRIQINTDILKEARLTGAQEITLNRTSPSSAGAVSRITIEGCPTLQRVVISESRVRLNISGGVRLDCLAARHHASIILPSSDVKAERVLFQDATLIGKGYLAQQKQALCVGETAAIQQSNLKDIQLRALAGARITLSKSTCKGVIFRLDPGSTLEIEKDVSLEDCRVIAHPSATLVNWPVEAFPVELIQLKGPTGFTLSEKALYQNTRLPNGFTLNS